MVRWGLLSERRLTVQMDVVRIGSAVIRPRHLEPAETADAENKQDREYREVANTYVSP
jgi:hypothetical protein